MKFFPFSALNVALITIITIGIALILWCINITMSLLLQFVCLLLDRGR